MHRNETESARMSALSALQCAFAEVQSGERSPVNYSCPQLGKFPPGLETIIWPQCTRGVISICGGHFDQLIEMQFNCRFLCYTTLTINLLSNKIKVPATTRNHPYCPCMDGQ